jgi:hypothetical protein
MSSTWIKRIPWIAGIAYWILMIINHRFHMWDFQVYYSAADAFIHGDPIYGQAFGLSSGFYKYSPFAVIPFVPLALLPYFVAQSIYYFTLLGLIIRAIYAWNDQMRKPNAKWSIGATFLITLIFFGDHLERELFLGNVNFLLLTLLFWAWKNYKAQKWKWSGFLLAVVILFKPHFIVLIPLLLLLKQWDWLKYTLYFALVLLLAPAILVAPWHGWGLLGEWWTAMQMHNVHLYDSPNTLYGIFNACLQYLGFARLKMGMVLIVLAVMGSIFIGYVFKKFLAGKWPLTYAYLWAIAAVPSITHTDTEHFLFSIPLFIFWVTSYQKNENCGWDALLVLLAFVPFALNSPDLVGKKWSLLFDEHGGIGWANLFLMIAFLKRMHVTYPDR